KFGQGGGFGTGIGSGHGSRRRAGRLAVQTRGRLVCLQGTPKNQKNINRENRETPRNFQPIFF
ncbi:MAG: hypothetical protein LBC18_06125, partial [Opitutaceae bacterium]|nr:hypothetical protein [Opitutaceae bacterium]